MARMAAAAWCGQEQTAFIVEPNQVIEIENLESLTDRLADGTPIQYIIGKELFCGEEFEVRQGVLIPRPETEELVMWAEQCANYLSKSGCREPRILDICTGSGCIAISLKKLIPSARVTAIDLYDEALDVARRNQKRLEVEVEIIKDDALRGLKSVDGRSFDIIVSNPPYIPLSEREQMHINVKDHEPMMALFVDDQDPLIFYREIAIKAMDLLSEKGYLLFEIHERLHQPTIQMLRTIGFSDIELRYDFREKPRMICCRRRRE